MQINKPKLLGITFLHILFLAAVLGITSAIGQPTLKEPLKWSQKTVDFGQYIDYDWISLKKPV